MLNLLHQWLYGFFVCLDGDGAKSKDLLNLLSPRDDIWQHKVLSTLLTLTQVMAWDKSTLAPFVVQFWPSEEYYLPEMHLKILFLIFFNISDETTSKDISSYLINWPDMPCYKGNIAFLHSKIMLIPYIKYWGRSKRASVFRWHFKHIYSIDMFYWYLMLSLKLTMGKHWPR